MKAIERYILREFLKIFALSVSGLVLLFLIVDVFENMDTLIKHGVPLSAGILYFAYKLPYILTQVCPVATLLSTLISLGILSRHNELVAMKSCGIRLLSIIAPILVSGLFISVSSVAISEYVTPPAMKGSDVLAARWFGLKGSSTGANGVWIKTKDGILNLKEADLKKGELNGITLYGLQRPFRVKERLEAKKAVWRDNAWVAREATVWRFSGQEGVTMEAAGETLINGLPGPEDFSGAENIQKNMTMGELKKYIDGLEADGLEAGRYYVDLYSRVTFPAINFIMVLIGIPFAMGTGRKSGLYGSIGIAIIIAFSYWLIFAASRSLGQNGVIPPIVAAAFPDALYLAIGILMFGYVRQ